MKEDGKWLYGVVIGVHQKNDDFFYDLKIHNHTDKKEVPQKLLRLKQRKASGTQTEESK